MKFLDNNWINRTVIVSILLMYGFAQATTMVVDDPNVEVNNNGLCSLAEAIIHANEDFASSFDCPAGSGADTIELSADVTLGLMALDSDATYGFTGTPTITSTIIIDGMGHSIKRSTVCTPDGTEDMGEFRLLRNGAGGHLTLNNVTLENGCADGVGLFAAGGAILNHSGATLTLTNSVIKSNRSYDSGGAIFNTDASTLTITSSKFIDNIAVDSGGALANEELATVNLIDKSEFFENHAIYGGAVINVNGGVINNIKRSTFSNNASSGGGGAINNTSADLSAASIGTIENSTFSGNSASNGGAIVNYLSSINALNNLTFVDNTAAVSGAAVWNYTNSTVGVLSNSLFKNNTHSSGNECTGVDTGSDNLSDRSAGFCSGSTASSLTASKIAALAYDGGVTMTHALLPGSEAINASGVGASATDQRGLGTDGIRDIGAFEHLGCLASGLNTDGFNSQVDSVERFMTAIDCANSNGNLTDTIELAQDINLSEEFEIDATYGKIGTPIITSSIVINGLGHQLKRDANLICNEDNNSDFGEFRLLFVAIGANLTINNLILKNGCVDSNDRYKSSGGAMINLGTVAIMNSVFSDNSSGHFYGGAIYNVNIMSALKNNKFSNNSANTGGAIFTYGNIATIENNTFSNNSALFGGVIYNQANISTIKNNTFTNSNVEHGGGIYNTSSVASITNIINNTFSENSAIRGAGIENTNDANIGSMDNNLFYQNSGSDCYDAGTSVTGSDNLSNQDANNCSAIITPSVTLNVGALLDNGCMTPTADGTCVKTHGLLPESQAIDFTSFGTTTDQRGFSVTTIRDVGAFEVFEPTVIAPADLIIEATGVLTAVSLGNAAVTDVDETGLMATPNETGPFTLGQHVIIWAATDSQGHTGMAFQTVTIVDTTKPVISLNGDNPLILNLDDNYIDPQATVTDNYDDTIQINGTGTVDTSQIGNYQIYYNHTDSNGNNADEVVRVVFVMPNAAKCLAVGYDTNLNFNTLVSTVSELQLAIYCANENNATTDTINLVTDIIFSGYYGVPHTRFGHTATPVITSPIILNGNGYIMQRDSSLNCNINGLLEESEFRLMRIDANGDLTLENITLANACADGFMDDSYGGGIYNLGNLAIINSQFIMNKARYSAGIDNYGVVSEINSSTFYGNESINSGGGIYNNPNGMINSISNNTFSQNKADVGAAIFSNAGIIDSMLNNTFSSNESNSSAAGVYNFQGTITNMSNNLFVSNHGYNVVNCYLIDGTITGNNNMSDSGAQGISGSNCIDANGLNVIDKTNLNPNTVESLVDNDCANSSANNTCVMTHALLMDSQAIDAGNIDTTTHDQRGFLANGVRDIGAFEFDGIDDFIFKNGFD